MDNVGSCKVSRKSRNRARKMTSWNTLKNVSPMVQTL